MPLFEHRCPEANVFGASFAMGNNPDIVSCPQCRHAANSQMPATVPSEMNLVRRQILDITNARAQAPWVVNSISGTGNRQSTAVSRHQLRQRLRGPSGPVVMHM